MCRRCEGLLQNLPDWIICQACEVYGDTKRVYYHTGSSIRHVEYVWWHKARILHMKEDDLLVAYRI